MDPVQVSAAEAHNAVLEGGGVHLRVAAEEVHSAPPEAERVVVASEDVVAAVVVETASQRYTCARVWKLYGFTRKYKPASVIFP